MICLRCGYCCIQYEVVIVKDPSKGIVKGNLINKPTGKKCPHLVGSKPGKYRCAIHNYKWYKETPCYRHTQIEKEETSCRLGKYIMEKEK